jgi:hypothetical protein
MEEGVLRTRKQRCAPTVFLFLMMKCHTANYYFKTPVNRYECQGKLDKKMCYFVGWELITL